MIIKDYVMVYEWTVFIVILQICSVKQRAVLHQQQPHTLGGLGVS
jgi:hypothetical protein